MNQKQYMISFGSAQKKKGARIRYIGPSRECNNFAFHLNGSLTLTRRQTGNVTQLTKKWLSI